MHSLFRRLLLGIVVAVTFALGLGAALEGYTRQDAGAESLRTTAATIQRELETRIDDPLAMDAHLARVHSATGLDLRLMTDLTDVPRAARRAQRRDAITFAGRGRGYIPLTRNEVVVGVVELRSAPQTAQWPVALAVGGTLVFALLLGGALFARQLARPLEQLATSARRFGSGNLGVRVGPQHRAPREVADVAHAFDEMAARIEHLIADQQALLGAVSHELRSPLTRALLALAIARTKHAADASLASAEQEIHATNAILEDLLMTSRVGLSDLRRARLTSDEIVAAVAALRSAPETLSVVGTTALQLCGDRALLVRALDNIVQNAYKYGHPPSTPLVLRIARRNGFVRFSVEDVGCGFAESILPRAFEPFVRGDAARDPARGSGLGLALVRRIARAHGGRAGAENRATANRETHAGSVVWLEVEELPADPAAS
jgi:signal transduction histidine kinase